MVKQMRDLKEELLDLTQEERAGIVEFLLQSLEQERSVERAWMEEARRRHEEIRAGRMPLIDNEEVFARLRARYG